MPRKRILSTLTALSLAGGTVLVPFIAPVAAAETAAQTMAEQYEPYYLPLVERGEIIQLLIHPREGVELSDGHLLPYETDFELLNTNSYNDNFIVREKESIFVDSGALFGGTISVHVNEDTITPEGSPGSVEVLVRYPDGSSEVVSASYHVHAPYAVLASPNYPASTLIPGETANVANNDTFDYPAGVKYNILETAGATQLREEGWEFSLQPETGTVTATAPDAEGTQGNILIEISYPDGSFTTTELSVKAMEPTQEPEEPEVTEQPTEPEQPSKPAPAPGGSSLSSSR